MLLNPNGKDDHRDSLVVESSLYGEDRIVVKQPGHERRFREHQLAAEEDGVRESLEDFRCETGNLIDDVITERLIGGGIISVAAHVVHVLVELFAHFRLHVGYLICSFKIASVNHPDLDEHKVLKGSAEQTYDAEEGM